MIDLISVCKPRETIAKNTQYFENSLIEVIKGPNKSVYYYQLLNNHLNFELTKT